MIAGVVGGISTGISVVNKLGLGPVDPQREAERLRTIDTLEADAIQTRSKTSRPYVRLACLAGASPGSDAYQRAVQYGIHQQGQPCRTGSDSALAYAKIALAKVDAAIFLGNQVGPIVTDVAVEHVALQLKTAAPYIIGALALVFLVMQLKKGG